MNKIILTLFACLLLAACQSSHSSPVPQAVAAIEQATQKIEQSNDKRQTIVAVIELEEALQAIPGMQEHKVDAAEAQQLQQATAKLQAAIMPKINKFPQAQQSRIKAAIGSLMPKQQ